MDFRVLSSFGYLSMRVLCTKYTVSTPYIFSGSDWLLHGWDLNGGLGIINTPRRTGIMTELYSRSPSKSRVDWSRWHFDIDNYLNPFIPAPPWRWIPRPISHFLGYRGDQPPRAIGSLIIAFWALIGAFCGVSVVSAVTKRVPSFEHHHGPSVVASMVCCADIPLL